MVPENLVTMSATGCNYPELFGGVNLISMCCRTEETTTDGSYGGSRGNATKSESGG